MQLGDHELLVFTVPLVPSWWARFVPGAELERLALKAHPSTRAEATSIEGAARRVLSKIVGCRPEAVPIERTAKGKPWIAGGPGFSVAHARDLGLVAVARRRRVGVDLEPVARDLDSLALAEFFFPARERAAILAAPESRRVRVTLEAFTRFEAAAKATGEGLTVPMEDFDGVSEGLDVQPVDLGPDWVAAVAADGPRVACRVIDATDWCRDR